MPSEKQPLPMMSGAAEVIAGKKIILGITGGIAAYKATDLASWLRENGASVHCVMTQHATEFISPLVLQALTGNPVVTQEFVTGPGWGIVHIDLAAEADLLAIVPATANVIAKIAAGIADDALTSTVLAADCPCLIAPAMNTKMYNNTATQTNLQTLAGRGWHIVEPWSGRLACGTVGKGKLPAVAQIEMELTELLRPNQDLAGKSVLITAGPTVEPIDPVRYISNRSSGKMGYALAEAAHARGARVQLISGPVDLPAPAGVEVRRVQTAAEMQAATEAEFAACDMVIMAAAVADYRVDKPAGHKIKKTDDNAEMTLKLVKNPDILAELGRKKTHQLLVGFAAETDNVEEYAKNKLQKKNADMLVANDVSRADAGFDVDTNQVIIFTADGERIESPLASKRQTADFILDKAAELWRQ